MILHLFPRLLSALNPVWIAPTFTGNLIQYHVRIPLTYLLVWLLFLNKGISFKRRRPARGPVSNCMRNVHYAINALKKEGNINKNCWQWICSLQWVFPRFDHHFCLFSRSTKNFEDCNLLHRRIEGAVYEVIRILENI